MESVRAFLAFGPPKEGSAAYHAAWKCLNAAQLADVAKSTAIRVEQNEIINRLQGRLAEETRRLETVHADVARARELLTQERQRTAERISEIQRLALRVSQERQELRAKLKQEIHDREVAEDEITDLRRELGVAKAEIAGLRASYDTLHDQRHAEARKADEARAELEQVKKSHNYLVFGQVKLERDKLLQFKTFVHTRLDEIGIPSDPGGPHTAAGCRIGDRLDLVARAVDQNAALIEAVRRAAAQWAPHRISAEFHAVCRDLFKLANVATDPRHDPPI